MANKLIIANWKAYEFQAVIPEVHFGSSSTTSNVIIAPSTPHLALLRAQFPDVTLAAQDVSAVADGYGAYTGEVPAAMLADMGVKYAIIGHSERRSNGFDNNESVAAKVRNVLNVGITPIICVGETRAEREGGKYLEVVASQISSLRLETGAEIIIAYEPVWSIGTGLIPSAEEILEMMDLIRSTLRIAGKVKLVYGGSVNAENAKDIVNIPGVDGVLIGKASTDTVQFKEIIRQITMLRN